MSDTYDFTNLTDFHRVKILPLKGEKGDQGEAGVSGDYSTIANKPTINNVQVTGDMTASDLGLATQASVDALADNVYTKDDIYSAIINWIHPVGSIYISAEDVDPATLFPNTTWEQIKEKFLFGTGDTLYQPPYIDETGTWAKLYKMGATGGETYHKLTISEMPTHAHGVSLPINPSGVASVASGSAYQVWKDSTASPSSVESVEIGGDGWHNNMPPYVVVSIWKRTA